MKRIRYFQIRYEVVGTALVVTINRYMSADSCAPAAWYLGGSCMVLLFA